MTNTKTMQDRARRRKQAAMPKSSGIARTLDKIREHLTNAPCCRLAISLHEAGHIMYARRIAPNVAVIYGGPHEHPDRPGEVGGSANVKFNFPYGTELRHRVEEVARLGCAGSLVKRALMPDHWQEDEGDNDWHIFLTGVQSPCGCGSHAEIAEDETRRIWRSAQEDVERDLQSPVFREELWALARQVEESIPWAKEAA